MNFFLLKQYFYVVHVLFNFQKDLIEKQWVINNWLTFIIFSLTLPYSYITVKE